AAQSQIYGLEVFQYVNLQASDLDKRPTQIPIQVQVKERDLRSLSIGLGYGTEESFRVKADWTNRNFLGGIRILRANLKHSTKLLPIDAQIELSQPFFFDDQNDFLLRTFYTWQDEESYEARRIGVGTAFNRQLSGRNNVFITTRTERDSVRAKGNITNQNTNNLYNKSVLTTGFKHNSTNNLFTPSKGSIARIMIEESGLLFNSKFKYFKSSIEYRSYRELTGNVVFAFRLFLGSMKPYAGRVTTPIEERFYAGGSYSVRGWGRQQLGPSVRDSTSGKRVPVGGNSDLEGNLEIRYPIYKNLGGSVFLDFGNVWSNWNGIDVTTLKYALGTGLNYNTPIGPVRVDFAWKLNKQYANESNYQIHISIGQAF
ncbi:MAG: BamA/TamA family outer membrane protein, partial [Calditrichaceae bacterium]